METVGVREIRQNLSQYLRRTAKGETFTITDHGTVVGHLGPPLADLWAHIPPPKRARMGIPKPLQALPGPSLTDILLRMRADER